MNWKKRIVVDTGILNGKPVIKGTRLAVEFIVELLVKGWTNNDILRNYPTLTQADIQACLAYAGQILHEERVYPLSDKKNLFSIFSFQMLKKPFKIRKFNLGQEVHIDRDELYADRI